MSLYGMTDQAILQELGRRLRRRRLDRNLTQDEVATRAGINRTTVGELERGSSGTLLTLLQVLRAVDALDGIETLLPDTGPSPLELARRQGRVRRRATGSRGARARGNENGEPDDDPERDGST